MECFSQFIIKRSEFNNRKLGKKQNFLPRIGGKTAYGKIGPRRLRTQLNEIVDQLDAMLR